jgi:Tfp pilus assembly protein PilF
LGSVLARSNQIQKALGELGRAVQLAPDSSEYCMELSHVLLLSRNYSGAVNFLSAVEGRFGALPELHYTLALAYYGLRQYRQAIASLEKLIDLEPNHDLGYYYLGNSYRGCGDLAKAEEFYRKAIALNPRKARYLASLGTLLLQARGAHSAEGVRYLEKALQLDAADVYSKFELALFYERNQDFGKAQSFLEDVIRDKPGFLPAHVALARVYFRQGKKKEGQQERNVISLLESETQNKNLSSEAESLRAR